jgi:putative tryptophan/tyrosine transport system substrate-binding protein
MPPLSLGGDMRRREFLGVLGGAASWPIATRAQQRVRTPLVVVWFGGLADDPAIQTRRSIFRDALQELGWIDGRTVRLEHRASIGADQNLAVASELDAFKPDAIVTGTAPVLAAAYRQTKTVPIVFMQVTDPVSDGFVASLARPGGNVTGFTIFEHSFAGKWLEMLKEVVPTMTRVAVMQDPDHPAWNAYVRAIRDVASRMTVEVTPTPVSGPIEAEAAIAAFGQVPNGGVILLPSAVVTTNRTLIAAATLRHRLPSIYVVRDYPASGGLMSYGIDGIEQFRQAASYINRILKGAKPAELPVQASTKFEMVINQKTAKALGITVPATMLGRADEVIE